MPTPPWLGPRLRAVADRILPDRPFADVGTDHARILTGSFNWSSSATIANDETFLVIKNREKHKGTFETIHVEDAQGHQFATRLGNVFTIGKGTKPWVSLPKGKGIKLTIIEEQRKRDAAAQAAAKA